MRRIGLTWGAAALTHLSVVATGQAGTLSGTGTGAPDGDTITVRTAERTVRVDLAGIEAPTGGECLAGAATRRLEGLVTGKRVSVVFRGRVRARVTGAVTSAGRSPARVLVGAGLAQARPTAPRALRRAQAAATAAGRGIWGPACAGAPGGAGGPGGGGGGPAAERLVVPAGWTVLAGSPAAPPASPGLTPAERAQAITVVNAAWATLAQNVRGGRELFFADSTDAGGTGVVQSFSIRVVLCSDGTYGRRYETSGLVGSVEDTTGTWRIAVDLRTVEGLVPVLELTPATGAPLRETLVPDTGAPGRTLLSGRAYATGPTSLCT